MDALVQLKLLAEEGDAPAEAGAPSSRMYTDAQLLDWLALNDNDPRRAAYEVLLRKAENTQLALPGGLQMADNSKYWLRLARRLHVPQSGNTPRADDPTKGVG